MARAREVPFREGLRLEGGRRSGSEGVGAGTPSLRISLCVENQDEDDSVSWVTAGSDDSGTRSGGKKIRPADVKIPGRTKVRPSGSLE